MAALLIWADFLSQPTRSTLTSAVGETLVATMEGAGSDDAVQMMQSACSLQKDGIAQGVGWNRSAKLEQACGGVCRRYGALILWCLQSKKARDAQGKSPPSQQWRLSER